MSQGSGDRWRRQARGGGRCAVPSRADTAGGERLWGQGWGSGQVTAEPGVPPAFSSSVTPKAAQAPEAEACGVGEGEHGAPGPTLSKCPQLPKPP